MPDEKKAVVTGIEPNTSTHSDEGELRDEDIETIVGGAKNANNGEFTT
jgi:hypothetical protein